MINITSKSVKTCPFCKSGQLRPDNKLLEVKLNGIQYFYSLYAAWCSQCRNGVVLKDCSEKSYLTLKD